MIQPRGAERVSCAERTLTDRKSAARGAIRKILVTALPLLWISCGCGAARPAVLPTYGSSGATSVEEQMRFRDVCSWAGWPLTSISEDRIVYGRGKSNWVPGFERWAEPPAEVRKSFCGNCEHRAATVPSITGAAI